MYPENSYHIFPLGDSALTVDFGNRICGEHHNRVLSLYQELLESPLPGMREAVPAYSSLTVFYDPIYFVNTKKENETVFDKMKAAVEKKISAKKKDPVNAGKLVSIPVCYDEPFCTDLSIQAKRIDLTAEKIICIHLSKTYKVFMLGFMPGFSYMGEVDEEISMPRKPVPEMVLPGAVGIAGRQTGIYPFSSPGGWNIIGRTPMKLFNVQEHDPVVLHAGDEVQFYRITTDEFKNY